MRWWWRAAWLSAWIKFGHPIVLYPNDWTREYFIETPPDLKLHEMSIKQTKEA